ncbi:hypothetical protein BC833DRAFT_591842 [Globomyces pollinis-pini]|nr:hypothetical protein BC833DRAFT_591842 [Globomyces pollinis-pini]
MLLAILLLQTSMAQVCNKLPQDTLCGQEYAGYPIAKPIQDFNNSLTDAVANLDNVAANFAKGCGASNNVNTVLNGVSSLRFQVSIQCSFYVKEAIDKNCPVPPPLLPKGPLLCLDQCRVGAFSLQSFIRNSTTCPKGQTDPQLAQNYKFENEYCQFVDANIQANNNVCVKGSTLEAANCGWQSKTLAIQQCKTVLGAGFDDVCCKSLLDKENSSGSNTLIIIGVVVIVIIIIIAIGTLLFFKRRNAKSNRKSVEMPSYKNSDYDYNSNRNQYQKDPAPQKSPYNNNQYNQPLSVQTTPNYQKQQSSAPVQRMNPAFNYNQQDQKSFSATPSSGHTLANYSDQNINSDPRLSVTKPITPQSPINTQPTKQIKKVLMPEGAKEMITIHPYVSSMEDELQFSVGASIYLLKTYDDVIHLILTLRVGL